MNPVHSITHGWRSQATRLLGILLAAGFYMAGSAADQSSSRRPTLFLVGDSTVKNGTRGQKGWGEVIAPWFDTNRLRVANHAIGGRSSRTFLTEGRWQKVLAELQPGDFVLIQFGHNDGGALNDTSRARGTIKGTGEETHSIDNLLTQKPEVVHTYGWYLRKYIRDTQARGATPIVLSLVPRKIWKEGRIARSRDYAVWAAEVASQEKAPFVDLHEIVVRRYDALGTNRVTQLFGDDHTHTNEEGAAVNAEAVIAGLKALQPCAPCDYLAPAAAAVTPFRP